MGHQTPDLRGTIYHHGKDKNSVFSPALKTLPWFREGQCLPSGGRSGQTTRPPCSLPPPRTLSSLDLLLAVSPGTTPPSRQHLFLAASAASVVVLTKSSCTSSGSEIKCVVEFGVQVLIYLGCLGIRKWFTTLSEISYFAVKHLLEVRLGTTSTTGGGDIKHM